jgi:hypothetical protein
MKKATKKSNENSNAFWKTEQDSNSTRRADLTNLDYITIQTELLPMSDHEDDTINSYRDIIYRLTDKKILNLSGYSNTELKYQYGAANLKLLTEYDNNYLVLVSILHKWAERLDAKDFTSEAAAVLEYAISCQTDVTKSYKLLANIYKKQNTPEKINHLMSIIIQSNLRSKDKLLEEVKIIQLF